MVRERPPRLRLLRWLRSILLMAQPPLLQKEGNTLGEFIQSCFQRKPAVIDRRYSKNKGEGECLHVDNSFRVLLVLEPASCFREACPLCRHRARIRAGSISTTTSDRRPGSR